MLKIITDKEWIEVEQSIFERQLRQALGRGKKLMVGWRGGAEESTVYWSSKYRIWVAFERGKISFWNAFGIEEPRGRSASNIVVEVNFPYKGIYRKTQGAFAEDVSGNTFVIHRGGIGGGRKGIGKSLFIDEYMGSWVQLDDGDYYRRVALVANLGDKGFVRQLASFVHEVDRIKSVVDGDDKTRPKARRDEGFSDEFIGKRKYRLQTDIEAECNHGIIVRELRNCLRVLGYDPMNDRHRDVYLKRRKRNKPIHFEVKTSADLQSIYSSIGQLQYHLESGGRDTLLVAVLPKEVDRKRVRRLREIGITTFKYSWDNDNTVIFHGLKKILKTKEKNDGNN